MSGPSSFTNACMPRHSDLHDHILRYSFSSETSEMQTNVNECRRMQMNVDKYRPGAGRQMKTNYRPGTTHLRGFWVTFLALTAPASHTKDHQPHQCQAPSPPQNEPHTQALTAPAVLLNNPKPRPKTERGSPSASHPTPPHLSPGVLRFR